MGGYVASKCVGHGHFATAWKAQHQRTGEVVVLKNVDRTQLSDKRLDLEIAIMLALDHPHIVKLVEVLPKTPTNLVLVLEYCNHGDLFQYIQKLQKPLKERHAKGLLRQLASGLRFMLRHGIVHRDLKPQNLLLAELPNGSLVLKIADFGYARFFSPNELMETHVGSPMFMAPEMLSNERSPSMELLRL